jgi:hypothetical protein
VPYPQYLTLTSLHPFRLPGFYGLDTEAETMYRPTMLIESMAQLSGLHPTSSLSIVFKVVFGRSIPVVWRSTDGTQINLHHMGEPV